MGEMKNTRLYVCLDEQTYMFLNQKASYADKPMKRFLRELATQIVMETYKISVHDLDKLNIRLEELVRSIEELYSHSEHTEDHGIDGERQISLFRSFSECLTKYYQELLENREQEIKDEIRQIREKISNSNKSTPRDTSVIVPTPKSYEVDLILTQEEKNLIYQNMQLAGREEVSFYMRELLSAKRYLIITWNMSDLDLMVENIYTMERFEMAFMSSLRHKGAEHMDQAEKVNALYLWTEHIQDEIWNVVENDRKQLYSKYIKKIREKPKLHNKERRRRRMEKELWQ